MLAVDWGMTGRVGYRSLSTKGLSYWPHRPRTQLASGKNLWSEMGQQVRVRAEQGALGEGDHQAGNFLVQKATAGWGGRRGDRQRRVGWETEKADVPAWVGWVQGLGRCWPAVP